MLSHIHTLFLSVHLFILQWRMPYIWQQHLEYMTICALFWSKSPHHTYTPLTYAYALDHNLWKTSLAARTKNVIHRRTVIWQPSTLRQLQLVRIESFCVDGKLDGNRATSTIIIIMLCSVMLAENQVPSTPRMSHTRIVAIIYIANNSENSQFEYFAH